VTQALQLMYDVRQAAENLHHALKPGGQALVTLAAITPVLPEQGEEWHWSFTGQSARRLFGDAFGADNVEVATFGNSFAATCFLQGLAQEDIGAGWLDPVDPAYPVIVAVKATKAGTS
jgi:hypothetical protein